ncbi:MarR family transcriptional regulator [Pseudomonas sp. IT-P258]
MSLTMTDEFSEAQASVLIGTAEKMIEIWNRLSPEKQATLLARFGTQENALAALVTTQLVAPAKPE